MSRETRLLITAAIVAVAVLWLLARVRFRDRPTPPSPIPAVLGQLTDRATLDELASEVGAVTTRVRAAVVAVDVGSAGAPAPTPATRAAGLRVRDDTALAWMPAATGPPPPGLIAVDRAAGLALLRAPGLRPTPPPASWAPRTPAGPRYVMATAILGGRVTLRPAFMPAFEAIRTPFWPEPAWAVPAGSDLAAGSLVFTSDAEVIGLVVPSGGRLVIVPAATLLAQAERLLAAPPAPPGRVGIEVQGLTPALAAVTGASAGVVVAWVDRAGAAQGKVDVGDVIEAVDGRELTGRAEWDVMAARLTAGGAITLRVRRGGTVEEVALTAEAVARPSSAALGLTLRPRPRAGAEIVDVDAGSAGDRAGLAAADLITRIGDVRAPTPRQVTRAFAALQPGARVLVGVSRGDAHIVTTLERPE